MMSQKCRSLRCGIIKMEGLLSLKEKEWSYTVFDFCLKDLKGVRRQVSRSEYFKTEDNAVELSHALSYLETRLHKIGFSYNAMQGVYYTDYNVFLNDKAAELRRKQKTLLISR